MNAEYEAERELIQHTADTLLMRNPGEVRPTIAELLRQTGLPRWKLTHRHRDLNDEFLTAVGRIWGPSATAPSAQSRKFKKLKKRYKHLRASYADAQGRIAAYAEIIEELRLQLSECEKAGRAGIVRLPG